ncbi:Peptide chain release factor 1 [Candidatus Tremblaya princeps]|uniref:Peptide chain release factor 1 n=1 Tax=Tremblaya princeps TaxID=189385 RepID=A0A143WNV6_TREPR|nr:Peptide chain release factor 1 [Candidatus Tremblaya princeps]
MDGGGLAMRSAVRTLEVWQRLASMNCAKASIPHHLRGRVSRAMTAACCAVIATPVKHEDLAQREEVMLEVSAGVGGEDAAAFAAELLRMYTRYATRRGWRVEVVDRVDGERKAAMVRISGLGVYRHLRLESGCHRVQRVPSSESQGRLHTSVCRVCVSPCLVCCAVDIDLSAVRIDTFRASGAGGQHVNKTDSAVRATHLPTGIVVQCQSDRSQHRNKESALKVLRNRVNAEESSRHATTVAETRRMLMGRGTRAERIRTYNFHRSRIVDHRIGASFHRVSAIMDGDLDIIIARLCSASAA